MNNPLVPYYFYLLGCLLFVYCAAISWRRNDMVSVVYFFVSVLFLIGTVIGMIQTARYFYHL